MISSRRDYLLRMIEEVSQLLARLIFQRTSGRHRDALHSVVAASERLFGLEADKLFQFTPDQHFAMLTVDQPPDIARDQVLLYAALNAEAGHIYAALGNRAMSRASFVNALRFTLRARAEFTTESLPAFAPKIPDLLAALADEPLDDVTSALVAAANL